MIFNFINYKQIFIPQNLNKMHKNLIFDIGFHKGEDAIHYLKSGFKVLGVEANPLLVKEATTKFKKYIDEGKLTILNIGIAKEKGILPFYKNNRLTEWSSFEYELGTRSNTTCETVNVECIPTDVLIAQHGVPFYFKVDIEGFDLICISSIPSNNLPKYLSCEASTIDCLEVLQEKGYKKFKIISQLNNFKALNLKTESNKYFPPYQIIKNGIKLRLQKFITFKHPYGSAGPFAENTDGPWLTYEEAKKQYLAFFQYPKNIPLNNLSWFDFHATY